MRTPFRASPAVLAAVFAVSLAQAAPGGVPLPRATPLPLPGSPGKVTMDYLAYQASPSRVWVPAGNTGRVDVVDTATLAITEIGGFPVATHGDRVAGPSSATVGEGFVYVGNRGNSQVCAIDSKALKVAGCATLASPPDGIAFVAAAREVWVTTPRDKSLTILDVSEPGAPKVAQVLHVDGEPEGYAVDAGRGRFYTNLEDADATLVFDVKARKQVARYSPGCGKAGPRGLALDPDRQLLFVACTDKVVSLRLADGGKKGGELDTGGGVDNIDYVPVLRTLFAASGATATLTIAGAGPDGALIPKAKVPTAPGTRAVAADATGVAFVADSAGGRLWVVK